MKQRTHRRQVQQYRGADERGRQRGLEPAYLDALNRYARILKQRNALLQSGSATPAALDAWDAEFSAAGGTIQRVRAAYTELLAKKFDATTGLFGNIPEFDSMAVVTVVTALEERFGIVVEDDEITADIFETVGSLSRFVEGKLGA